jgi:predicted Zn-dependent peptidase
VSRATAARAGLAGALSLVAACSEPGMNEAEKPSAAPEASAAASAAAPAEDFTVPVEYHKLDNGLKVVISEDHTVPIATVGVYYHIGFRTEPKGRTGFAHLFEHMMFQGSENLGKMEFIQLVQGVGGVLNGSTRFDFTNYFEAVPAHKVETALWAEADRMRGLAITQENLDNQKAVVKNEVKVNVLNQPYGGFPWLDMPQYANENWYNAHNFYGDFEDLDAATLEDVQAFFDTYYAPNNAVVVVVGDVDPKATLERIREYFGDIPSRKLPPQPDISEPRQTAEKRASRTDPLAPRPAVAFAYHVPERWTPEWHAMGLLDEILLQGEDSRLNEALVKKRGMTDSVSGGINLIGNMFNYDGPMLWTAALVHDPSHTTADVMAVVDEEIERIRKELVPAEELRRARLKLRSGYYDAIGSAARFGLVDLLASLALFDDDPARVNGLERAFDDVTPELIRATAAEYLRPENRTVLTIVPGQAAADEGAPEEPEPAEGEAREGAQQ